MQHEYEIMANTTDFFPILLLLYNIEDGVLERAFLYTICHFYFGGHIMLFWPLQFPPQNGTLANDLLLCSVQLFDC